MNNKLIYTSYDGDNIPLIDSFIKLVIDFKYIPINPTKSLGYYISTSIHDNDKGECLRDCLSLEMICDELWVFIDNNKYIPEGVRLEIATWLKYKSSVNSGLKMLFYGGLKMSFFSGLRLSYI